MPGLGGDSGDPCAAFLPPAIETDTEGNAAFHRAVVIVTDRGDLSLDTAAPWF